MRGCTMKVSRIRRIAPGDERWPTEATVVRERANVASRRPSVGSYSASHYCLYSVVLGTEWLGRVKERARLVLRD